MGSEVKQDPHTCTVCINASTLSVNIGERTPLIRSSSNSTSTSSGNNNSHRLRYQYEQEQNNQFSWLPVAALLLFFVTGIGIATYLLLNEGVDFMPEIYTLVTRNEWNASTTNGTLFTINVPSDSVIVTDTETESCDNLPVCGGLVTKIQYDAQSQMGLPDMEYNFLIDDHGTIYEGLGWYHTLEPKQKERDHLIVALIGNYLEVAPSNDQLIALNILLEFAVHRNVLKPCYTIKVPEKDSQKLSLIDTAAFLQVESFKECTR